MPDFQPAYPHGDLREVADGVFFVTGTARMGPGMTIGRNMTVVRQGDELTLMNGVRLNDEGLQQLDALGKVKHILKVGNFHGSDDPFYVDRYGCQVWALPGSEHKPGVKTDREIGVGKDLPIDDADLFVFEASVGAGKPEGAVRIDRAGGVLVTADSLQNWERVENCSFLAGIMTRLMFYGPARVGPVWAKFVKDGGDLRNDFQRLLAWQFEILLSGHGQALIGGAHKKALLSVDKYFR